jgi:post-segregation antitoxin (ccd killing protein)
MLEWRTDMANTARRATNVTIDQTLFDEAKGLGLNISRAAESGIETAVRAEKERLWQSKNTGFRLPNIVSFDGAVRRLPGRRGPNLP